MATKKTAQKKKPAKQVGPAVVTPNGTEDVETFEPVELPYAKEEKETSNELLVRGAEKADILATKPKPAELPFTGPKEQLFECPQGCIKIGPLERNSDFCAIHGIKINARR